MTEKIGVHFMILKQKIEKAIKYSFFSIDTSRDVELYKTKFLKIHV